MSVLQAAIVDQLRRLRELEEAIAVELRKSVRRLRPSAEPRASLQLILLTSVNITFLATVPVRISVERPTHGRQASRPHEHTQLC